MSRRVAGAVEAPAWVGAGDLAQGFEHHRGDRALELDEREARLLLKGDQHGGDLPDGGPAAQGRGFVELDDELAVRSLAFELAAVGAGGVERLAQPVGEEVLRAEVGGFAAS